MAFRAARATLLFPQRNQEDDIPKERPSVRRLDAASAVSVLGAMVEQRRRSQPPPPLDIDLDQGEESPDESGQRPIVEKKSIGFIKIR